MQELKSAFQIGDKVRYKRFVPYEVLAKHFSNGEWSYSCKLAEGNTRHVCTLAEYALEAW